MLQTNEEHTHSYKKDWEKNRIEGIEGKRGSFGAARSLDESQRLD